MKTESILVINSLLRLYTTQKEAQLGDAQKAFDAKPSAEASREVLRAKSSLERACRVQADFWREDW